MEHTYAYSRIARRLSLVGALTLAATIVIAPMTRAAEELDIRTASLSISGGAVSRAVLALDSDGDGWTDWVERLYGTDATDPESHPQQVMAEIVGTTVYLQPPAFPDRMVVITVALPEGTLAGRDIMPRLTDVAGLTPNSKFGQQMKDLFSSLYDGGVLETTLASIDKGQASLPGFGRHTNGLDISLIAGGDTGSWDVWNKLKDARDTMKATDVSFGTTKGGNPYVELRTSVGTDTYVSLGHGDVSSMKTTNTRMSDGSMALSWIHFFNGVVDGYGNTVTHPDGSTEYWRYDGSGKLIDHGTTPPKAAPGGTTGGPTVKPASGPTGGTTGTATGKATETATAKATETATGDTSSEPTASSSGYRDPDADRFHVPTAKEAAERIAFLTGVRVHTVQNAPTVTGTLVPKPGVSDPADPACKGSMCVFFVEVVSPDFTNVVGGDPVPSDLADRTPPLR